MPFGCWAPLNDISAISHFVGPPGYGGYPGGPPPPGAAHVQQAYGGGQVTLFIAVSSECPL